MHPLAAGCRELTEEGQLWVQYTSSAPATRLDVVTLQERLDQQLQQRQVRPRLQTARCRTMGGGGNGQC